MTTDTPAPVDTTAVHYLLTSISMIGAGYCSENMVTDMTLLNQIRTKTWQGMILPSIVL